MLIINIFSNILNNNTTTVTINNMDSIQNILNSIKDFFGGGCCGCVPLAPISPFLL